VKWNIDDVPVFRAVVEQNGITAAARRLGMPKSTVSKAVSRLEQALGVRLLDRNSRNMRITGEGETFYRQCVAIMDQVDETDAVMTGLTATPAGRLSVALPPAFCQEILAPHLADFRRQYPEIELDLTVTSQPVDILRDQFDLAVVVGAQEDSDLTTRTLLAGRLVWIASPAYRAANEIGDTVDTLRPHIQLCEKRYAARRFAVHEHGRKTGLDLGRGIIHVNDPLAVRKAVIRGAGVSFLPDRYCAAQLQNGELEEVCENIRFDISASTLSAVFPSRRLMSGKTRAFLEFLNGVCRNPAGRRD
jgi:LysR family transcriptional regulator for bpeEF and oprC